MSNRIILGSLLVCLTLALSACQWPRLHRVTVQQGNVISQDMVNQLEPGMTRSQVAYVMGEPILKNPFDNAKWDYVYSVELPGYYSQNYRMTLFFENDTLAYFTGDLKPQNADELAEAKRVRETALAEAQAVRDKAKAEAQAKIDAKEAKKNKKKRKDDETG